MNQLKNILVAVDFSDCSKAALAQAVHIARWNGARLHALHVIEPLVVTDVALAMHASQLDATDLIYRQGQAELQAWLEETGGPAEVSVVVGSPMVEPHLDTVAKRATALGGVAAGTVRQAAAQSELTEFPNGKAGDREYVTALVDRYA